MTDSEDGEAPPPPPEPTGLDDGEFHEAFNVFSDDREVLSTANSVLIPFLKSVGLRDRRLDDIAREVKEKHLHGEVRESDLRYIVESHTPQLRDPWPSDEDVRQAFRVFDREGVGFIKVTLLKRFLVQAQLEQDEGVLERLIRENCQIDGDDLINYDDFVAKISQKYLDATSGSR